MTWSYDAALAYLRPPEGAYWCWEDNGRVLSLTDGTTIAFREEVVEVLQALRDLRRLKSFHRPPASRPLRRE